MGLMALITEPLVDLFRLCGNLGSCIKVGEVGADAVH